MIQSGITHKTNPQVSQKTNERQFLSSADTTHPALPEHPLLHNGLKPLPSSAAEQIYISLLTLFCNLLCVEASGFQGLELLKGDKPFPCFLLIVFPTQKSESLVTSNVSTEQPQRERMCLADVHAAAAGALSCLGRKSKGREGFVMRTVVFPSACTENTKISNQPMHVKDHSFQNLPVPSCPCQECC